MIKQRFFRCKHCGNFVGLIKDEGPPLTCCGEAMAELVPNTHDASVEKHVPEVTVAGDRISVQVGSTAHPMEAEHHISFIYVETESGGQRKCLKVGEAPKAEFSFIGDKPIAVFEYCNLHGLWVKEL
ncbi:MAG: desulfoferrodoxin [Oscillospiraceae bacterium]|nr:desulfoferrodoxin [Oscillospiraceae bacterium]